MVMLHCVLCHCEGLEAYSRDRRREYWRCPVCDLVQVPATWHLDPVEEKAHYDLHENDPGDAGYRRFLSRALDPVLERLESGAEGLDFGCGPGPVLSLMFREQGFDCREYDIFYAPDETLLQRQYDFITATEVVEHLAAPGEVLNRLWGLLRPRGVLAIMTKRVLDADRFANWHYRNDPTHIVFFHRRTFEWLARQWRAGLEFPGSDVALLLREEPVEQVKRLSSRIKKAGQD